MPFEPRIHNSDDERREPPANRPQLEGDHFASPDLELLAAQLSDDAAYLARLYPPGAARRRPPASGRWTAASIRFRWASAAAVLFLLGLGGAIAAWSADGRKLVDRGQRRSQPSMPAAREMPDLSAPSSGAPAGGNADHVTDHVTVQLDFEFDDQGLEPGALLRELSASEQEAVLDLLEDQPIELARISL